MWTSQGVERRGWAQLDRLTRRLFHWQQLGKASSYKDFEVLEATPLRARIQPPWDPGGPTPSAQGDMGTLILTAT